MTKFVFVAAVLSSACGKPSDVPALREEATSLVARTGPRVAAIKFRLGIVQAAFEREDKYKGAPDHDLAKAAVKEGNDTVAQLEAELTRAPAKIEEDAKDETGAKLVSFTAEHEEAWQHQITRAMTDAETGETWLGRMQQDAAAAAVAAANPPPPQPEAGSGSGSGSATETPPPL